MLTLHALGQAPQNRAWLLAHDTDAMPVASWIALQRSVQRRIAGEPIAYITGCKEFYGLTLHVDARVLDPRDDTETLVDWALELLAPLASHPTRVVDLGTGSGAIALALKAQNPQADVHAVDSSEDALVVARDNASRLHLPITLHHGSWLDPLSGVFDLIVSNPPYIPRADPHLDALTHEPLQALASGQDGLDAIRTIVAQSTRHLPAGGWLLLEHGYDQADRVHALLLEAGFGAVQSRIDLAGIRRCTGGRWMAPK